MDLDQEKIKTMGLALTDVEVYPIADQVSEGQNVARVGPIDRTQGNGRCTWPETLIEIR